MTVDEKLNLIIKTLDAKKAEDIQAIKISDLTIIADYFIIANGTSTTQTRALADEVEFKMKQQGAEPLRIEGERNANWIIIDYGDVVVHVFYKETREHYNLERLWADGEHIDVSGYLTQ